MIYKGQKHHISTELAQGDICAFDPPNTSKEPFSKKMSGVRVFEGLREQSEAILIS